MTVNSSTPDKQGMLGGFMQLLDRQSQDKVSVHELIVLMGLYDIMYLLDLLVAGTGTGEDKSKTAEVKVVKDALQRLMAAEGGQPNLGEMVAQLAKNPGALVGLLNMLAGPPRRPDGHPPEHQREHPRPPADEPKQPGRDMKW